MTGRLDGKVAIVTGAASRGEGVGNGKAMSILFAREGARVVLVNRSEERAEALRDEIAGEGGEASVFAGDATRAEDAGAMVAAAEARYGRLDILVNNVGIGGGGTAEAVDEADWDEILEVREVEHLTRRLNQLVPVLTVLASPVACTALESDHTADVGRAGAVGAERC